MNRDDLRAGLRAMPMWADKTDDELDAQVHEFTEMFGLDDDSDIDPMMLVALMPHVLDGLLEEARRELSGTELVMIELLVRGFQDMAARVASGDPTALAEMSQLSARLFDKGGES